MAANIKDLTDSRDTVNKMLERFGVRFGVYKKGVFNEQLFPFDSVHASSTSPTGTILNVDCSRGLGR